MTTVNFGNISGNKIIGLSSGLDTEALVTELSAVKKRPIDTINAKIDKNTSKVTKFGELNTLLTSLKDAANFLKNPFGLNSTTSNIFKYRTSSLSSATLTTANYLSVEANPGALIGNSTIKIGQLATALEKRSGPFNARDTSATTAATGSYFNAGSFQIGAGLVKNVTGDTLSSFTLSNSDYTVEGTAGGVVTLAGITNINVVGGSGGQPLLEGTLSGFTGTLGTGTATFSVVKNGVTYTSNAIDVTQSVNGGLNAGIQAGTVITFTGGAGGANETSFQLTTLNDVTIDNTLANVTGFASDISTSVSGQTIFQSRKLENFTDANVKSPLTGLTNSNVRFYSDSFQSDGEIGEITGFTVQKSTGSDGAISVNIGGETFRATGLGTILNTNLVLQSTTTDKELRINLADAAVSVDISSDSNATSLERSFDYAFGTRELKTVTVASGDSLNDVVEKINTVSASTGASAGITKVSDFDYRFSLKANNVGVDNRYDIFDASNVLTNVSFTTTSEQDAKIKVDGIEITRSTNSITDAIENTTLNLISVTPNYGIDADSIQLKIENDNDTAVNGIVNFINAYNNIRVFYSEQNQRDTETSQYTKDAILGGDTTLQSLVNQLLSQVNSVVGNTSDTQFNTLSDIGIKLTDFAGDDTNVATTSILTYDDATLRSKISSNFDKLKEIFELRFTSSSQDLLIFKTSNTSTLTNFKLEINNTLPTGQQIKLLNADGSDYLVDGDPVYLNGEGTKITSAAGTVAEGLEFIYTGDGTDTISITLDQGIADKVFNLANDYVKDDGVIDKTVTGFSDSNTDYKSQILTLQDRLDAYIQRLQDQFTKLESALSSLNNTLSFLEANTNAANSNN
jgi:flagellar hook-associated protein 2